MAAKLRVFFDINVVLDVLQKREPFYDSSAWLLGYAETGKVQGCIAAHSLTTLFYIVSKHRSTEEAHVILTSLMQFLQIAAVTQETIEQALNLPYKDFEDAVQMSAALQWKADYLATRNVRDYQPALVKTVQPIDLLAAIA
jgi:predicted nucleic acid-binding protein